MSNLDIKQLLEKLEKLRIPRGKYLIYGSGRLAARGLREIDDLDVAIDDEIYNKLAKKYPERQKPKFSHIVIGEIDLIPAKDTLIENFDQTLANADIIFGHKFVRLDDLIRWKKKMGRKKDFEDIKLIEKFLKQK